MDHAASSLKPADRLSDFRADRRMLLLAALAVPIGMTSAFVAKALLWLIALLTNLAFFQRWSLTSVEPMSHHLGAGVIAVPVVGAVIIGLMARFGSEKIRGHGIPEALEAILLGRSLISPKVAILKPISSAISIGTGGPFGAEGPIIMTGGALGSLFAQCFHLTAAERKTLLVAGAAGGMAAIFATPIAAVLLAIELLLFEWKPRSFVPVSIAAIIASIARVPMLGEGPLFGTVQHAALTNAALAAALAIGLAAGLCSGLLTRLLYLVEDSFEHLGVHWMWWPAIGAVVVGLGGFIDPRVLGVGYGLIHQLIRGEMLGMVLVGLFLAKTIVWVVALGSGTSGGVLAPLLIIGGSVGALLGEWLPGHDVGLGAMVGMSAMMGGTMRSPLTGMIFLLELTYDLHALPALLIGSVTAYAVTVLLMRRSILTEKLARRGQHIACEYSVDVFEMLRVADAMDRTPPVVSAKTPLSEIAAAIEKNDPILCRRQAFVVVDEQGGLEGLVMRADVMRLFETPEAREKTIGDLVESPAIVTCPDETLHTAVATLLKHDVGRLVVVDRTDPRRVVGYLGRGDILAAQRRRHEEEYTREGGPRRPFARKTAAT